MIKWLGENGGELVGTNKILCMQKIYLCIQIRFLCRLHRGCSIRGSRMLYKVHFAFFKVRFIWLVRPMEN
jgi:hypothetical protein